MPVQCAAGKYSNAPDKWSCTNCDAGYACPAGSTSPTGSGQCGAGKYSLPGDLCSNCFAGYACPAGSTQPSPLSAQCPGGKYSFAGAISCTNCNAGYACAPGSGLPNPGTRRRLVPWLRFPRRRVCCCADSAASAPTCSDVDMSRGEVLAVRCDELQRLQRRLRVPCRVRETGPSNGDLWCGQVLAGWRGVVQQLRRRFRVPRGLDDA
jgi:hypothetical protein